MDVISQELFMWHPWNHGGGNDGSRRLGVLLFWQELGLSLLLFLLLDTRAADNDERHLNQHDYHRTQRAPDHAPHLHACARTTTIVSQQEKV